MFTQARFAKRIQLLVSNTLLQAGSDAGNYIEMTTNVCLNGKIATFKYIMCAEWICRRKKCWCSRWFQYNMSKIIGFKAAQWKLKIKYDIYIGSYKDLHSHILEYTESKKAESLGKESFYLRCISIKTDRNIKPKCPKCPFFCFITIFTSHMCEAGTNPSSTMDKSLIHNHKSIRTYGIIVVYCNVQHKNNCLSFDSHLSTL